MDGLFVQKAYFAFYPDDGDMSLPGNVSLIERLIGLAIGFLTGYIALSGQPSLIIGLQQQIWHFITF